MAGFFEIGTNYCEKVTLGWPEQPDNFFLSCFHVRDNPMVSARIFGPDGTLLFELANNELSARSLSVYRRIGFHNGWKISDQAKNNVLEIVTEQGETPRGPGKVTHINGNLYDKDGKLVCEAGSRGLIAITCACAMG